MSFSESCETKVSGPHPPSSLDNDHEAAEQSTIARTAIAAITAGQTLSEKTMAALINSIINGDVTQAQIGALLTGLRIRGETVDEIVGAARAIRARATQPPPIPGPLVDTCGTGGDGKDTVNISTLAALVVATCGVRVAKHGNRAVSSRCGSADLLSALGLRIDLSPDQACRCVTENNFGFFFSPLYHSATRLVSAARREIGIRTIFNILGPLTNPAKAQYQVVGTYDASLIGPMAKALGRLGVARAMVVHGVFGIDEFSPAGGTRVAHLADDGNVELYSLNPRSFGLEEEDPSGLTGGDTAQNTRVARQLLAGAKGAARNVVVMTAASAMHVAGAVGSLREGADRAQEALDCGAVSTLVEQLRAWTLT